MIVENLGNVDENSISMFWDSTSWDSVENSLELYDESGNQIPALTLAAGEQKIISARLSVPTDASLEIVSTPLTMCVGSGEDETCQTVQLQFIATSVVTELTTNEVCLKIHYNGTLLPTFRIIWDFRLEG